MRKVAVGLTLFGIVLVLGCAGRSKTNTAHDESVEHGHPPESPKSRADHRERAFEAE